MSKKMILLVVSLAFIIGACTSARPIDPAMKGKIGDPVAPSSANVIGAYGARGPAGGINVPTDQTQSSSMGTDETKTPVAKGEIGGRTKNHAQAKGELIVNFAYAQEKIRQGDTWKIYLSVTDPEANMHRVVARIIRPGATDMFRPSFFFLKGERRKELTGHFALHTRQPNESMGFVVELSILDRTGNERKTFRFPLEFDGSTEPMAPLPPNMEKELSRRIGNIDADWDLQDF